MSNSFIRQQKSKVPTVTEVLAFLVNPQDSGGQTEHVLNRYLTHYIATRNEPAIDALHQAILKQGDESIYQRYTTEMTMVLTRAPYFADGSQDRVMAVPYWSDATTEVNWSREDYAQLGEIAAAYMNMPVEYISVLPPIVSDLDEVVLCFWDWMQTLIEWSGSSDPVTTVGLVDPAGFVFIRIAEAGLPQWATYITQQEAVPVVDKARLANGALLHPPTLPWVDLHVRYGQSLVQIIRTELMDTLQRSYLFPMELMAVLTLHEYEDDPESAIEFRVSLFHRETTKPLNVMCYPMDDCVAADYLAECIEDMMVFEGFTVAVSTELRDPANEPLPPCYDDQNAPYAVHPSGLYSLVTGERAEMDDDRDHDYEPTPPVSKPSYH